MWRTFLALFLWLNLGAPMEVFAPREARRWNDLVETARAGPQAWASAVSWGLHARWTAPAGTLRQRRADACGPAALHAFLAGRPPRPTQDLLWSLCRSPQGGATLGRLAQVAGRFGCECDVLLARTPEDLHPPAILHLTRGHFVLLAAREGPIARVLDPACGWMRLSWAELRAHCSGAVLVQRGAEVRS